MNGYIRAGLTLALAASAATAASAEVRKYGEAGGWEINVNDKMGPGCLAVKKGDDMQVQVGIQAQDSKKIGYMAVFTRARVGVKEGSVAPVTFELGGKTYSGEAFGERMEGFEGAWVPFEDPNFVDEMAKQETMKVMVEGMEPIDVSLAGTNAAFKALRECQDAQ